METDPRRTDIINFMAPINDTTASRLIDITSTAHAEGTSQIHLLISSVGGLIRSAFTAYNFFRTIHIPFFTHNIGNIETAAALLFLSSDRRAASPCSKFLFHSLEWSFYRDHVKFAEVTEAYESLKFDIDRYSAIFAERTGGTYDIADCLTGTSRVLDPAKALEAGIVTNPVIAPPAIPELAKMWSIHN